MGSASNGIIFDDLEWSLTRLSRSLYTYKSNISKSCVSGTKLLKNTNRKLYMIYRMVPLSMTLSDLWPRFQAHDILMRYRNLRLTLTLTLKSNILRSKNDWHLFNGLDEVYHHAKFREDRTTRAGCRCDNVFVTVFCLSRSEPAALFLRGGHSSNKYCVTVYGSILMWFHRFFQNGSAFLKQYTILISSLDGATNSEKWRSKIAKILKIDGKVFAHHFV